MLSFSPLALIAMLLASAPLFPGKLGPTEADARKTELFTFFNLAEVSRGAGPQTAVRYRPSGPDFHDQVVVTLTLQKQQVTGSRLVMKRSFISAFGGTFSKDVTSSFLTTSLSDRDATTLIAFLNEINLRAKQEADESAPETEAHKAYTCQQPSWSQNLQDASVSITCIGDSVALIVKDRPAH